MMSQRSQPDNRDVTIHGLREVNQVQRERLQRAADEIAELSQRLQKLQGENDILRDKLNRANCPVGWGEKSAALGVAANALDTDTLLARTSDIICGASCGREAAVALLDAGLLGPAQATANDDLLRACKSAAEWLAGWASAEPYLSQLEYAIAKASSVSSAHSSSEATK